MDRLDPNAPAGTIYHRHVVCDISPTKPTYSGKAGGGESGRKESKAQGSEARSSKQKDGSQPVNERRGCCLRDRNEVEKEARKEGRREHMIASTIVTMERDQMAQRRTVPRVRYAAVTRWTKITRRIQ